MYYYYRSKDKYHIFIKLFQIVIDLLAYSHVDAQHCASVVRGHSLRQG